MALSVWAIKYNIHTKRVFEPNVGFRGVPSAAEDTDRREM